MAKEIYKSIKLKIKRDDFFVALCSKSMPKDSLQYLKEWYIDYIITGETHVDLTMALVDLYSRYVIKAVRVDSGGTLNGLFLRQGLVSEVSILIYPSLVRGETTSSIFRVLELATAPIAYLSASLGTEGTISLRLNRQSEK